MECIFILKLQFCQAQIKHRKALGKCVFKYEDLLTNFKAQIYNQNKLLLDEIQKKVQDDFKKELIFARYPSQTLPETFENCKCQIEYEENSFEYKFNPNQNEIDWHLNFADPYLFTAYGGGLFAQDEIQVAEHPILGNLAEALKRNCQKDKSSEIVPFTSTNQNPTPCLIRNIERKIQVNVDQNVEKLRPYGLYGNAFQRAKQETILKAVDIIDPPTITNLICMAALYGGSYKRVYTEKEIILIWTIAYSGFLGAKLESLEHFVSASKNESDCKVIVHTGNWGTGAFGNNKQLMALIQMIAAKCAKIDNIKFHTFNQINTNEFLKAQEFFNQLTEGKKVLSTNELLQEILQKKFEWGQSDGN